MYLQSFISPWALENVKEPSVAKRQETFTARNKIYNNIKWFLCYYVQ